MDPKPNESSPDRVLPPPEQQQITGIIGLVDILAGKADSRTKCWDWKDYIVRWDFGDSISDVRVEKFAEEGARIEDGPRFPQPFVTVSIARRNEDGATRTKYNIYLRDKGELTIDRHEDFPDPKGEAKTIEELLKFRRELRTMTSEQARERLRRIIPGPEQQEKERALERQVGESYVDSTEAAQLIDILTRLTVKQNLEFQSK